MSRKQDYIAKVEYENNLPAPLLPPKLLKYRVNPEEHADSAELITSLYSKTSVTPLIRLNDDLGMPLDLMKFPGLLNNMDTKYLYELEGVKLAPEDRVLLRAPGVDKVPKADMSKVTFLRRTEYVSTSISSHAHGLTEDSKKRTVSNLEDKEEPLVPKKILEKVENTFEAMTKDLSKIQHPIKKKVRAVRAWNLLPDTASMDQNYFSLRLVGSATLDKGEKEKLALATSIFRPVELEEDEWISMYTTDNKDSDILSKDVEKKIEENLAKDENEGKTYKFQRVRDFDMKQVQTQGGPNPFDELAIVLNNEKGVAYFKPLRSRIELRRRRVNDVIKPLVREHNVDQINISFRNPTPEEANMRDRLRMKFDPIDFAVVDEEERRESDNENPAEDNVKGEDESQSREGETVQTATDEPKVEEGTPDVKASLNENSTEKSTEKSTETA
ncbi:hypothetical protein HG535_0C05060 [Zygotorulaspora mrakii]|uniref:Uncharacterized protein n=1 Tax=Zygotorulaspora mrakii TaxID=42260 RepID=A0A7H9B313_ZYGMR|nr:uncharacterized protein HG535_0C05060 [Zygotorulaspora mrakii]QLG72152.1 hypothetical protein HG535_0C05060 [Zygotorulaspora mrakii]